MDDAPDTDEESTPPRPFSVVAAALATCGLGMVEARQAEVMLALTRGPAPPPAADFKMAYVHALWAVAQEHRRGFVAVEVARLVLAALLFVAAARVLVQVRASGWLWRQALAGNVAVTLAAAWYEHTLRPAWVRAFERALEAAAVTVLSPQKEIPLGDAVRLQVSASVALTGLLGAIFLAALAFSLRARTRAHTG